MIGVPNRDNRIGVRHFTCISRMSVMIEQTFGVVPVYDTLQAAERTRLAAPFHVHTLV